MIQKPIPASPGKKQNRSVRPVMLSDFRQTRQPHPSLDKVLTICADVVRQYRGDVRIVRLATDIVNADSGFPKHIRTGHPDFRNFDAVADAVYRWLKQNVVYKRDPYRIEWVQTPDVTASDKSGDCDDMSILAASLLGALGIQTRFKVTGSQQGSFSHIYIEYLGKSGWTPFDVTLATHSGDEVPENNRVAQKFVSLDDSQSDDHNLGFVLQLDRDVLGIGSAVGTGAKATASGQKEVARQKTLQSQYIMYGLGALAGGIALTGIVYSLSK